MWYLLLLTLVNAVAHQDRVVLRYRLSLGGMPIDIIEGLLAVGVVIGLLRQRSASPSERVHPLLTWTLLLFGLGVISGVLAGLISNAELRWILQGLRNFIVLPAGILIGYCFLLTPRSCVQFTWVQIAGGVAAATAVLLFFHRGASESTDTTLNKLQSPLSADCAERLLVPSI